MNDSNHTKQKEIEKIEIKLEEILREKFYTGAEHFSQLSAIDLFYLYGANTAPSEPVARRKRATHAGEVSHRKRTSEPLPNNAR